MQKRSTALPGDAHFANLRCALDLESNKSFQRAVRSGWTTHERPVVRVCSGAEPFKTYCINPHKDLGFRERSTKINCRMVTVYEPRAQ
jgi:hypothetical protein